MRHTHYKLKAVTVTTTLVTHLVAALQLRDYHTAVPKRLLARCLLLMAASRTSLSFVAQHTAAAPSDEALRLALRFNLPETGVLLLEHLLQALRAWVPARLRRRPQPAALDWHLRPYYGAPTTPGLTGGKRAAGTRYFWGYATLVLLVRGARFTVGLCAIDRRQSPVVMVQTLLRQAAEQGCRLRWLLLDRGFYDAQVVRHLQQCQIPFVLPMIRRGDAARGTGTQRFFQAATPAGWYDYQWTAQPRQRDPHTGTTRKPPALRCTVAVRVAVVHPQPGKTWVYVAWGLNWDPALVRRRYRRRFGIETSYRQLGQSLAMTSSTDVRVHLLYVGLALLLRQYWAWAHAVLLWDRTAGGGRRLHPERLRLGAVLLWLTHTLMQTLGFRLEITCPHPIPKLG